jgi:hypothetical protein
MDNTIYEYIKNGITINGNPIDGYEVFTIPTQHFKMDSLHQLTPETFEREIQKQKEHNELAFEIFKEVQKEIDQEILNQLRGGEPNPDFIPMNTTDRLYKNFLTECDKIVKSHSFSDEPERFTQEEFINKLLTDDEFYEKWGDDCCEELTTREMCEMFGVDYDKVTEWTYHGKNIDRDLEVRTMLTDPGVGPNYPKRKLKENGN